MGMNLFNDNGDSDNDEVSKIEIDEAFARRYEHNKKREDLHRLEELKKKGIIDDSADSDGDGESDSDDDDDEDWINSRENDLEFFNALIKVKNQDPILKEKDAKLFPDESEDEEGGEEDEDNAGNDKKGKKGKAMYLKDVVAKHLIEDGPEYDEGERDGVVSGKVKSYADEQEDMRRAFLDAAAMEGDDDDESGELLKEKGKEEGDDVGDGNDRDEVFQKTLEMYFGEDEKLDENARFLKGFFQNKMYADKDKGKTLLDEELERISEEEEEVDKQEDYERDYNFRYQENAGDRVLGHSRVVEGSVRKKENARKVQRKSKEDRMAIAELERKEELKHLKNLKKKEYLEKIKKVREVAGISDSGKFVLNEDDLEEEYDPKEHDRKMKAMFNEDYYGAEDANPEFCSDIEEDGDDFKKPDFDKEDELLGLPKGWDDQEEEEEEREEEEEEERQEEEEEEEETVHEEHEEGKRKRKRKPSLLEKVALDEGLEGKYKKELEDELYKMDYEGTVGDLKTRFPYRKVQPRRFGLSAEEILMMDDTELNQYVSLKKIAPYREKDWKVPSMKRYEQKMKNKELLQGGKLGKQKMGKKKILKDDGQRSLSVKGVLEDEKTQLENPNGDASSVSRQSKRRRRQAELKLSDSRRKAYGKT